MVEIGFYEAAVQVIIVLILAEVARSALFANQPPSGGFWVHMMVYSLVVEVVGLFLSLAVVADPRINSSNIFSLVVMAIAVGCAGTIFQALVPLRGDATKLWQRVLVDGTSVVCLLVPIVGGVVLVLRAT